MAFYGCTFSFNGVSSQEYGLMIYDFGSVTQGDADLSSPISLIEDRLPNRRTPIFYGSTQNKPLEFNLVFGADVNSIDNNHPLDRWDVDAIAAWLTGVDGYKWLEIDQYDMQNVRYKCIISNMKVITQNMMPWAFSCKIKCDCPFAYTYPEIFSYSVSTSGTYILYSKSSCKGYYMPKVEIYFKNSTGNCSIANITDNEHEMVFSGVPGGTGSTLYIDCENEIVSSSAGINIYPYFNFKFLRLVRGENRIKITGNCNVIITCEFPVNTGG